MADNNQALTEILGRRKLDEAGMRSVTKFARKYAKLGVDGAVDEFEEIEKETAGLKKPDCKAFMENMRLNKSPNNICPDHTRVVLTCNVPPGTNYCNANWIKIPQLDRSFIVGQSPMENTINDFWRMVFQENCSTVLLTGEPKDNESPSFWPEKTGEHANYRDIFVNNRRVDSNNDFTLYKLELLPDGCSNSLIVNLIVFPGWTDRQLPKNPMAFLRCWKQFPQNMLASAPVIVCSRFGQGRAGAVLLLHAAILAISKGEAIDLKTLLKELRKQRPGLLSTPQQYCWVILSVLIYYGTKIKDVRDYTAAFYSEYKALKH